jgi:hypothetical protein
LAHTTLQRCAQELLVVAERIDITNGTPIAARVNVFETLRSIIY